MALKVLSIGSDRNLFVEGSAVSERIKEYGKLVDELHIVVFAQSSLGLKEKQLAPNIWLYPTNSWSRFLYIQNASSLGKKIVLEKKFVRGNSVITTQDPFESGLVGLKVKNKWRIPLEVQLHTDPTSINFNGFLNSVRKHIARSVIPKADSIRVVNKYLGDRIVKNFSVDQKLISVLPIYVDRRRIEEGQVTFDLHARYGWHFILLSVARLTKEKNLGLALEVLKRIRVYFPETGLVVVGAGPEEKRLKSKALALGVDSNVAFVGWQEDLASYYKSANLFLQTSFFEGYGLALVEAGLSNLPVVSTPVGIANDLENGKDLYVCPEDDPEYMFKAVYDLMENSIKRESLKISMKRALESKLISKEEYLKKLILNWEKTAALITENA